MSRGRRLLVAAAVVLALPFAFSISTASAAEQELEFTNTEASFTIGGQTITLPPGEAGISGTWDDVTGDFVGGTAFNPITIPANPPDVPVAVVLTIAAGSNNNVTGTIDPETGEAELTALMQVELEIPSLTIACTGPTFEVDFAATGAGAFAPLPFEADADYTMTLNGGFTAPAFALGNCGPTGDAIVPIINDTLGLPATGSTAVLALERGTPAPPTTPTTTATTAAPTTTAAAAVASQPRFTG